MYPKMRQLPTSSHRLYLFFRHSRYGMILFSGLFLGLLLLQRCSADQLAAADTLERQVLITWIALERGDMPTAADYTESVHDNWHRLRKTYGQLSLNQEEQRFVGLLDLWTGKLLTAVNYEQRDNALLAISLIQEELRRTRPRYGLQHPADNLYAFYHQWESIIEASSDPMMCLYEWTEYEELVDLAIKQWEDYQANQPRFMDTLFPGYGQNSQRVEEAGLDINKSLIAFKALMAKADHTEAVAPSLAIRALFFNYLALISDYPATEIQTPQ